MISAVFLDVINGMLTLYLLFAEVEDELLLPPPKRLAVMDPAEADRLEFFHRHRDQGLPSGDVVV